MKLRNAGNKPVFLASGGKLLPGSSITVKADQAKALLANPNIKEVKKK